MNQLGRGLIVLGVLVVFLGLAIVVGGKLGLGRLPGDLVLERKSVRVYFPIATSIILSLVLTLLANLLLRKR